MKTFIALFALLAVAVANPLPLVQIIVNVDAPQGSVGGNPVVIDGIEGSPAAIDLPIIDFVPEEATYDPLPLPEIPIIIPDPVVLPEPELPVVVPEPIVLPEPVLPVVVPETPESVPISPVVVPDPAPESVPISPVVVPDPVPESVPISPVVVPEPVVVDSIPISPITTQPQQS